MLCGHCDCHRLASVELAATFAVGREQCEKRFSHGLQLEKEFVFILQIEWNKNDHEFRMGSQFRNTEGFSLAALYTVLRESL